MLKLIILFSTLFLKVLADNENLLIVAIGNELHDATNRLIYNSQEKSVKLQIINETSVDIANVKLKLMKKFVNTIENNNQLIVFIETQAILLNHNDEIIKKYKDFQSDIVISSRKIDGNAYEVSNDGLMGSAKALKAALSIEELDQIDNYELYFSKLNSDPKLKNTVNIKLDTNSEIFRNLEKEQESEHFNGETVKNTKSAHLPAILISGHTLNGVLYLNSISNYIVTVPPNKSVIITPQISLTIFINGPTPFIDEFLERVKKLKYDKQKINLFISNTENRYEKSIDAFIKSTLDQYLSVKYIDSNDRSMTIQKRQQKSERYFHDKCTQCEYMLILDSVVQITKEDVINKLIAVNLPIVAPFLKRREGYWANFWGSLTENGFYKRSWDYIDIVDGVKRGIWNVPFISGLILLKRTVLDSGKLYDIKGDDADLNLCRNLRERGLFMWLTNTLGDENVGYLVDDSDTSTDYLHNDLWEIFKNKNDWYEKYIHKDYAKYLNENVTKDMFEEPCRDVFWWPLVSEKFASDIVEEMENFGDWSSGQNEDTRLEGGYEAVPTRDIHARQLNWEEHWQQVLRQYVHPIQLKLFMGYHDIPSARMNFVVRYKPTEQDRLRPHQDSSSYTLNIALNRPGIDYGGGGARFLRYDCAVTKSRVGWVLMHPGRVTHEHEGLPTLWGIRYIFVTFVNP